MNRQTPRPPILAERPGDYRPDPRKDWKFTDWAAI